MKNPFVMGRVGRFYAQAIDAPSRIDMAAKFTSAQCADALKVPGLQATVRKAIERRQRYLAKAALAALQGRRQRFGKPAKAAQS